MHKIVFPVLKVHIKLMEIIGAKIGQNGDYRSKNRAKCHVKILIQALQEEAFWNWGLCVK